MIAYHAADANQYAGLYQHTANQAAYYRRSDPNDWQNRLKSQLDDAVNKGHCSRGQADQIYQDMMKRYSR